MIPTIPLQNAGGVLFIWLIFLLIFLAVTYWVYQDAQKNSQHSAVLWALVVFLAPLLGLVLYFLLGRNGAGGRGHSSSQI
jgi:apolipoprotein N-acyltransferase